MGKNIWIINEYAGTPYHGMEFRHYYLGKELVKLGNRVTVISSSYSHLFKNIPKRNKEKIDEVDYLWLSTINYGSSHDKRRVLKWFIFTFKVFSLPFRLSRPDVIIVSPMAPFPILPAWILAKIYKAKLIYEVKDIWPLSLIELGAYAPTHPFIKLMGWFEKFALKKSDEIVSNLQNYGEHMQNDVGIVRDFTWISNGVDLGDLAEIEPLDPEVQRKIPKDKFIVGYTGTVGVANALHSLCEAAKLLQDNENLVFVIVGGGQEKEHLINIYGQEENILFIDSIAKSQVQSMLSHFDVCYIGLKNEKLFEYGVSPNKLFDYMYSAKPILYAINSGKSNIVETSKCGVSVAAEDPDAIARGVLRLIAMSDDERKIFGNNGRNFVINHFGYDKLAQKYIKIMEKEQNENIE